MRIRSTKEQIVMLHELCDEGMIYNLVSERVGISIGAISYHRSKIGMARNKHGKSAKPESKSSVRLTKLAAKLTWRQWMEKTGMTHTSYYSYKKKALAQNEQG